MSGAERLELGKALDGRLDPTRIRTRHRIRRTGSSENVPFVWTGGWELGEVARDPQARYIDELMAARGDPSQSDAFRHHSELISRGGIKRVGFMLLATEADLRWHFACYQRVAVSIATQGFLTAEELAAGDVAAPGRHPEGPIGNPKVSIGSDGTPHWVGDGRHRIAIAQWLGLRSVPVTVRIVDREWHEAATHGAGIRPGLSAWFSSRRPTGVEDGGRSREWFESLVSVDPAPELQARPDPDGTNGAVERALRLHRIGEWSEAIAAWGEAGAWSAPRPHVAVMAARTALASGDSSTANALVDTVLAAHPGHLAATEVAGDLGLRGTARG